MVGPDLARIGQIAGQTLALICGTAAVVRLLLVRLARVMTGWSP